MTQKTANKPMRDFAAYIRSLRKTSPEKMHNLDRNYECGRLSLNEYIWAAWTIKGDEKLNFEQE